MTGIVWRSKFDGVPGRVGSRNKKNSTLEIQRLVWEPVLLNFDLCVCMCMCVRVCLIPHCR